MDLVLDCSIALAWCFDDEATAATDELLDGLVNKTAAVPSLWHLELANALVLSERKRRISKAQTLEFISLIEGLPIVVDLETVSRALGAVLHLARAEKLTSYDATYLELAMRLGVPLASLDRDLLRAAKRLGVTTIDV
jgi:predicted nucleic acid-binding protein